MTSRNTRLEKPPALAARPFIIESCASLIPVFALILLFFSSGVRCDKGRSAGVEETKITSVLMNHGSVELQWEVRPGSKYVVQYGLSLPLGGSWTQIDEAAPPWEEPVDGGVKRCFYRVFVPPKVAIDEIMYNPPGDSEQKGEFVELYNYGSLAIDLSGYSFVNGIAYTFRQGTVLEPGQCLVIVSDPKYIDGPSGELGRSPRIQAPGQTYACYVEGEVDKVPTSNPIYHLHIKPSDLSLIASYAQLADPAHPNWNKTVPGTFIHNGEVYDVQVRHRGSRWCRPWPNGKMSFKIEFPRYHQFNGVPDINLNSANHYGFTGYEEALAFEMFRQAGVAAPLTNLARFNINKNYHGFYFQIESPGEEFLQAHLGEEGDLFKSMGDPLGRFPYDWGDWRPLSSLQKYEDVYTRESRRYDSHEILRDVIEGMRDAYNTSPSVLQDFLEHNFDMDRTLSYIATAAWIAVWDEAWHNFFAYRDTGGKWMVFPWDTDGCFGANGASRFSNSIFVGEHGNPDNRGGWSNELKHYIFSVPALRKEYVLRLEYLNRAVFTPDKLKSYLEYLVPFVTKDGAEDPFGWGRTPAAELDDVRFFVEQRYENIKQQIQIEKNKPYFR